MIQLVEAARSGLTSSIRRRSIVTVETRNMLWRFMCAAGITAQTVEQRWTDEEWRVKKMIDIHQTTKAGAESICPSCDHYLVCRAAGNQPCVECNQYAPVAQHGKWVSLVVKREDWKGVLHDFYQPYSCSICQNPNTFMGESAFCPHCGARMDGAENE